MKESISQRLNTLISETGLRQTEILEKSKPYQKELNIKMGKSALSQYINGKSNPNKDKLTLLARTFEVSEAWLLGFDVPKNSQNSNIDDFRSNNLNKQTNEMTNSIDLDFKLQHTILDKLDKQIELQIETNHLLNLLLKKLNQ